MPAFVGIALQMLGGWLKKLLSALLRIQVPAIIPVALLACIGVSMMNARHTKKLLTRCEQKNTVNKQTIDNLLKGQAEANAHARKEKAATEAKYLQIQKDSTNAYKAQLVDARARLAQWMRSRRAAEGGSERADLPHDPNAPTGPDGVDPSPVLVGSADLDRCTQAYVTATSWQEWWRKIEAVSSLKSQVNE